MSRLAIAVAVIAAYVFQTSVLPRLAVFGARPDLLLVVLVYVSLLRGPTEGAVLGFLTGLLFDLSSPQTLGAYAFARSMVGFGVGSTSESLERGSLIGSALVVLVASLLHDMLYLGIVALLAQGPFPSMMAAVAVPAALYTALVTPPVFWLLRRFVRLRRARRRPA